MDSVYERWKKRQEDKNPVSQLSFLGEEYSIGLFQALNLTDIGTSNYLTPLMVKAIELAQAFDRITVVHYPSLRKRQAAINKLLSGKTKESIAYLGSPLLDGLKATMSKSMQSSFEKACALGYLETAKYQSRYLPKPLKMCPFRFADACKARKKEMVAWLVPLIEDSAFCLGGGLSAVLLNEDVDMADWLYTLYRPQVTQFTFNVVCEEGKMAAAHWIKEESWVSFDIDLKLGFLKACGANCVNIVRWLYPFVATEWESGLKVCLSSECIETAEWLMDQKTLYADQQNLILSTCYKTSSVEVVDWFLERFPDAMPHDLVGTFEHLLSSYSRPSTIKMHYLDKFQAHLTAVMSPVEIIKKMTQRGNIIMALTFFRNSDMSSEDAAMAMGYYVGNSSDTDSDYCL